MKSPFKFLDSYTKPAFNKISAGEEDENILFGRDKETEE